MYCFFACISWNTHAYLDYLLIGGQPNSSYAQPPLQAPRETYFATPSSYDSMGDFGHGSRSAYDNSRGYEMEAQSAIRGGIYEPHAGYGAWNAAELHRSSMNDPYLRTSGGPRYLPPDSRGPAFESRMPAPYGNLISCLFLFLHFHFTCIFIAFPDKNLGMRKLLEMCKSTFGCMAFKLCMTFCDTVSFTRLYKRGVTK